MTASPRRKVWWLIAVVVWVGVTWQVGRSWLRQDMADDLQRLVRPGDIRMVSSETCVFCASARHWLTQAKLPFDECFVERDAACAAAYSAQGAPGTPLLFVRGRPQLGFSPQRVRDALAAAPAPAPSPGG